MKTTAHPSPNFNERAPQQTIKFVVVHYTEMKDAQDALGHLCDPQSKVSAHYLIDRSGEVFSIVDEKHRAWHAGVSFWRGEKDINSASIGIELDHNGHALGYTSFCAEQIDALKALLHDIGTRYQLPPTALLAHSDIAPLRKMDPGELFPWEELAKEGFGLWPKPEKEDCAPLSEEQRKELLDAMGYDIRDTSVLKASMRAFLRRFHPERLDDGFNEESDTRLSCLARMWAKAT